MIAAVSARAELDLATAVQRGRAAAMRMLRGPAGDAAAQQYLAALGEATRVVRAIMDHAGSSCPFCTCAAAGSAQ
jgi:hypothetical protein